MSDHYLEIPYFKKDFCLASATVVFALGAGKRERRKRVVQGKV